MDRFQHRMRTTQHAKSVEQIMTRTNYQFFPCKSPRKRPSPQGENITTYLRKFEIERQNVNLAKRIMQCESQHSKDKYIKEWQNVKRFLKVRSNFKKTLYAKEPQIFKFQTILGKGRLKIDFSMKDADLQSLHLSNKKFYKFSFMLGSSEFQPDKNLITYDLIKNYSTIFYAPLFLKKRKITCNFFQVHENDYHEIGRFQIDLANIQTQQTDIFNRMGKSVGKMFFDVKVEGGRKKLKRKIGQDKQNQQTFTLSQSVTLRKNDISCPPQ